MSNRFNFYEIVKVVSTRRSLTEINGREGVVLGMAQNDDGSWGYAISVDDVGWSIHEDNLVFTGKFSTRDQFYSDSDEDRVRVIVDESGEGRITDE